MPTETTPPARLLSARTARLWGVVPLSRAEVGAIRIATRSPASEALLDNLTTLWGCRPEVEISDPAGFETAFQNQYGMGADMLEEAGDDDSNADSPDDGALARFVLELLAQALAARATDIHIEPYDDEVWVRFRIDGLLRRAPVGDALKHLRARLVSRLKVMAGLNMAERRRPQDGRFRTQVRVATLDVRVAAVPTVHGESIDLRLLPAGADTRRLDELGLPPTIRGRLEAAVARPGGMVVVTGPTGHGKTTTLYAALETLNNGERKIVTIEDPVEMRVKGFTQIQAQPQLGLTFGSALRAVLRQDPDVIMVGEMRDAETAEIGVRAALTGHLVLGTLHTPDAAAALVRLIDMGVEPYLVASAVTAVTAQRLVPLACGVCGGRRAPFPCALCGGRGVHGRIAVFEWLELSDELRDAVARRASAPTLRALAARTGWRPLGEHALELAARGLVRQSDAARLAEDA